MDTEIDVVLTTAPNETVAQELVETLVRERHAACGNIIPGIRSVYWWEGVVQRADEVVVILKTARGQTAALLDRARQIHPYDVPELIALPVRTGDPSYLDWVSREASGGGPE